MKRYSDLKKNQWSTTEKDLVYLAIVQGIRVYIGYKHEMPENCIVINKSEAYPIADSVFNQAKAAASNIFIIA